MFEIELLFQAENEFSDAFDWYQDKQFGLGNRLFNEVNHYLNLIQANPFQFAVKYREDLRMDPLRIFPYLIIYWIDEPNNKIIVTSIFHTSRKPQTR